MNATTFATAARLTVLLVAATLIAACSSSDNGTPNTNPLGAGSVTGFVLDIGTGTGVASAAVSAAGKSTTTDSRGYFSLTDLSPGPVTVSVSKDGFAPAFATPRAGEKPESTLVSLKRQGAPQSYSPSADKTLSQSTEAGPYAVTFVANSLDTSDTNLKVSITPVDPTKESSVLPGSLVTASSTLLLPVTFAEFSILDSSGKRVQLKAGQSATVELPIPPRLRSQYTINAKIHCYAFNSSSGAWDDFVDGTVRASTVDGTTPVLAAAIKHFSWYGGAPEGNNCFDVVGRVVSLVDGQPLGNARVEATPGAYTYTDADGYFTVVASGTSNSFVAYQTGFDVDGSLTGMKGAKYIEFGQVEQAFTGLPAKPCSTTAPAGAAPPPGTLGGRDNPVVVKVGTIAKAAYQVTAILIGGGEGGNGGAVQITVQQGVPGPDGKLTNLTTASGAKITISSATASASIAELVAGTGVYGLAPGDMFKIEKGKTYQLAVDADGNGSIDGSGAASVVGDLALTTPTDAGSYPAAQFTASWTDSGTSLGGAGYSAVYYLGISGQSGNAVYFGSGLQFTAYDLIKGPGMPLAAGTYTASLVGYSGFVSGAGGNNVTQSNNITGVGLSGTAYSVGNAPAVSFQLQ